MENPRGITRLGNKVMANRGERRKELLAQTTAIQSSTGESEGPYDDAVCRAARTCVARRWGGAGRIYIILVEMLKHCWRAGATQLGFGRDVRAA